MATQVVWGTLAKVTGGLSGSAPELFVGSSDQTEAVITTAGAIADKYAAGIFKVGDIVYVNGDQDGTPFINVYSVTSTSGGSLVAYAAAVGGALLAANNLSDVVSASSARTNLGLGTGDSPTFTGVTATGAILGASVTSSGYFFDSAANALTAHAGGGQASALQLAKGINRVTVVATAGDSVKLPAAVAGMHVVVINADAADAMDCFPASGESINALSADTALSIAANKTVAFFCAVAGIWNSIVTA